MDGWKNKNGILQIYPRSYRDANGDGVGDLPGIIETLSYIKGEPDSLNIDAIWLSPFYPSPMADFGYDIADYCDVDPLFGTIDDFKQLLHEAHERDISVMIDLIPNHTSNQHTWFKEALSDPDSPKRDYYIFRDGKETQPPNNWLSVFGGPSWEKVDGKNEYYLHSFLKEQPDLNWHNPAVQEEFRKIIHYWCELGVDGFRVDAIRWMGKDLTFNDEPVNPHFKVGEDPYNELLHIYSQATPELDIYLKVLTDAAKEYPNRIILFEAYTDDDSPAESQLKRLYTIDPMVAAPFHFGGIQAARSPRLLAEVASTGKNATPIESLPFYCFGNHDKPRLIGRVGEDVAKAIALIQLTLPGVPVIYYGEEIGM
ncbi:MAG: alpha-amylase family glycosyl hydrolase, partial [Candidatus Saccharimonadales bacterium]